MKKKEDLKFIDVWGLLPRIRTAIKLRYNIILRGNTGTGKTFLVRQLAKEHNKNLVVLNMTAGVGVEEIKGRYVIKPNSEGKSTPTWVDGVLVQAMKTGDWVVIEEANFMPEELASILYSVMDDRKNIVLDEHDNEVVEAHPDFRLFLTANWGYKGTTIPNDAIRGRCDFYADLKYLPEKYEARLITRVSKVKLEVAKLITKFAWRQRAVQSRYVPDIGTRTLLRWACLISAGMEPVAAGEHTIVSLMHYDETEKKKVRDALVFEFEALSQKKQEKIIEPEEKK